MAFLRVTNDAPKAAAAGRLTKAARRPLAFVLHSLIGLKVSVLLIFVCFTGTIATVSHELEWLFMPQVRGLSQGATDNWGAMWDLVRAAYPDAFISSLTSYDRADTPYFARKAYLVFPDGREMIALVDPARMAITGTLEGHQFHSIMRGLHYYLFLPTDWPFYLITSLGFVLAMSMVTGLIVYKKFWRGFFKMPRFAKGTRTWIGDLHRLAALWSIWFVAIIAFTSIWYFFERMLPNMDVPAPVVAERLVLAPPSGDQVNAWVAKARAEMPGISITTISMPYSADEPAAVQGQWKAILVRERVNAVFFDPVSGQHVGNIAAHKINLVARWIHTADPLHFGNFAGLISKLIWVVFGLILTGLGVSGAIIYVRRLAGVAARPLAR